LATQKQSKQEKREGMSQKFKLATLNRQKLIYFPHFCGWSHDLEIKLQDCWAVTSQNDKPSILTIEMTIAGYFFQIFQN
jgi:hypothetical protein